jgi:phage shock protein PspC (stress-responsive transcriptional regulator)
MKKTISINISGILFHIEEDGYTTLKKYLDAINEHFSHYDDNHEIITDIENRIAEIFLSNLKNNKQVITAENVSNLIEKMGTIADFEAVENDIKPNSETVKEENDFYKYITPPDQQSGKAYRRLTRLPNSKILGGVCAGFANYFAIDPLWTRLVTILLLFSGQVSFTQMPLRFFSDNFNLRISLGLWTVIAYALLWVILPPSYEKPEDKNIKKLYRNPDDRVLGGIASGLAAYFNVDVLWIRLAFVGLIFAGGSGFVLYLILWIITPMAKSITERIEMKGGAITLTNIEQTIQENRNPENPPKDSNARKLLMAPFRIMGEIINGIGKALGPFGMFLLGFFRVVFGLIILFIGTTVIILPLLFLGVYTELLTNNDWGYFFEGFPVEAITELIPIWLAVSASVMVLIPGIIVTLLGISVLIKRSIIDAPLGFIAFGIWILSILICSFQIPKVVNQFKEQASMDLDKTIPLPEQTLVLATIGSDNSTDFGGVTLVLKGYDGKEALLEQTFTSKGRNNEEALRNASEVTYDFHLSDSTLSFQRHLAFPNLAKYRGQYLRQTLFLPYNRPFVMDRSILPILRSTISSGGYKNREVNGKNHWVFHSEGLLCLTCINGQKDSELDSLTRLQFKDSYFMVK